MKYEVGQPVWVRDYSKGKVIKVDFYEDGNFYGYDVLCFESSRFGNTSYISCCVDWELSPRPTLYWSIRQWVRSLVGKK